MFEPEEKSPPYHYFDTPDGEDIDKKLWAILKPTTLAALGASIVDMTLHSQPKNYTHALSRVALVSAPFFGVSIAFVLVTNIAAKFRQKDDRLNWILGGSAAGITFGTCCKSPMTALCGGALLGLAGFVQKSAVDADTSLFFHPHGHVHSSPWSSDFAYSTNNENTVENNGSRGGLLSMLGFGQSAHAENMDPNDVDDEFDDDDDEDYEVEEDENDGEWQN